MRSIRDKARDAAPLICCQWPVVAASVQIVRASVVILPRAMTHTLSFGNKTQTIITRADQDSTDRSNTSPSRSGRRISAWVRVRRHAERVFL
jgi:hypothetical protein